LTSIKAQLRRPRDLGGNNRSLPMPTETAIIVGGIVAMFAIFMVVLGAVWIWSNQKPR
jgi:hypothetical protein